MGAPSVGSPAHSGWTGKLLSGLIGSQFLSANIAGAIAGATQPPAQPKNQQGDQDQGQDPAGGNNGQQQGQNGNGSNGPAGTTARRNLRELYQREEVQLALGIDQAEHLAKSVPYRFGCVGQQVADPVLAAEVVAVGVQCLDGDGAAMRLVVLGCSGQIRTPEHIVGREDQFLECGPPGFPGSLLVAKRALLCPIRLAGSGVDHLSPDRHPCGRADCEDRHSDGGNEGHPVHAAQAKGARVRIDPWGMRGCQARPGQLRQLLAQQRGTNGESTDERGKTVGANHDAWADDMAQVNRMGAEGAERQQMIVLASIARSLAVIADHLTVKAKQS